MREYSRSRIRRFWLSLNVSDASTVKSRVIRVWERFTCCPPGPLDVDVSNRSSCRGIERLELIGIILESVAGQGRAGVDQSAAAGTEAQRSSISLNTNGVTGFGM